MAWPNRVIPHIEGEVEMRFLLVIPLALIVAGAIPAVAFADGRTVTEQIEKQNIAFEAAHAINHGILTSRLD